MSATPIPPALQSFAANSLNGRLRIKHLDLFLSVCEKQTLHRAAEASNMTQPAATRLIKELEDMLAVPLFERSKRGMKPTQYGRVLQRHAHALLTGLSALREEVGLVSQGAVGLVRLGIIPSLSAEILSLAVAETLKACPQTRFRIEENATTDLLARLARNDLDLIFGRVLDLEAARDLKIAKVYDETFSIVARAGHALAGRSKPALRLLNQATWILPPQGTPMRNLIDALFTSDLALRPAVAVECNSIHKMERIIACTDMVGVMPRNAALKSVAEGSLQMVRTSLGDNFAPISLISRRGMALPPVVMRFEQAVHAAVAALKLS